MEIRKWHNNIRILHKVVNNHLLGIQTGLTIQLPMVLITFPCQSNENFKAHIHLGDDGTRVNIKSVAHTDKVISFQNKTNTSQCYKFPRVITQGDPMIQ